MKLELKFKEKRQVILLQEELLWLQKSRNDWLKVGDPNTNFFHTSTLVRRRNKIEESMNDDGVWVEGDEELKNLAYNFFRSGNWRWVSEKDAFPPISEELRHELIKEYTIT